MTVDKNLVQFFLSLRVSRKRDVRYNRVLRYVNFYPLFSDFTSLYCRQNINGFNLLWVDG